MATYAPPVSQLDAEDCAQPLDDWVPKPLREAYQTVLARLPWPGGAGAPLLRTIGLTSSQSGEGVTTVAAQLAATAAMGSKHRVLLVDANLARPQLHRVFSLPLSPGLSEVLRDSSMAAGIGASVVPRLSVLPAGRAPDRGLLDTVELSDALETMRGGFDLVVFDLPAVTESSFALRMARLLDGVVLVVEAERVAREVAERAKQLLVGVNAQLLGAVLNKRREHLPGWLSRNCQKEH